MRGVDGGTQASRKLLVSVCESRPGHVGLHRGEENTCGFRVFTSEFAIANGSVSNLQNKLIS